MKKIHEPSNECYQERELICYQDVSGYWNYLSYIIYIRFWTLNIVVWGIIRVSMSSLGFWFLIRFSGIRKYLSIRKWLRLMSVLLMNIKYKHGWLVSKKYRPRTASIYLLLLLMLLHRDPCVAHPAQSGSNMKIIHIF